MANILTSFTWVSTPLILRSVRGTGKFEFRKFDKCGAARGPIQTCKILLELKRKTYLRYSGKHYSCTDLNFEKSMNAVSLFFRRFSKLTYIWREFKP